MLKVASTSGSKQTRVAATTNRDTVQTVVKAKVENDGLGTKQRPKQADLNLFPTSMIPGQSSVVSCIHFNLIELTVDLFVQR